MLKKLASILIISLFTVSCMGGIAFVKGGRVEHVTWIPSATIVRSENYKILGQSEGESSTFFLLGLIPITSPLNIEYALSQAVQNENVKGGDSMVNIQVWRETHLYFPIGTVSVIKVRGDVVSFKTDGMPLFEDRRAGKPVSGGITVGGK